MEPEYLIGTLKAVFFENKSNFYKVLLLAVEESSLPFDKDEVVVTGSFGDIAPETTYRFFGQIVDHPKYGKQFQAISYQRETPTTRNGLIAFLSGERFPGIGKKTAEKIVETLGEEAIDSIIQNPDALKTISGLTPKKRAMIREVLLQTQGTEKILMELAKLGFTNPQAAAIFQLYQGETLQKLKENPYQLIEDINGIGFRKADQLAEELGFPADNAIRIKGSLYASLQEMSLSNGDTYVEGTVLLDAAIRLLEKSRNFIIEEALVIEALVDMVAETKIMEDNSRFAIPSLYFAEEGIASIIERKLQNRHEIRYPGADLDKEITKMQKTLGITYGRKQIEAIKKAVTSPLFILTGGPGTGKTTVLNGIVSLYCQLNDLPLRPEEYQKGIYPILLAAPTGRAAKRMQEMTGMASSTIHRLLGLTGQENENEAWETQELEGRLLIIDETSMVDTWLMYRLLKSVPQGMQVILVGDKDQLPSVGPGQVLHDLLASGIVPQIELNQIFRQADGSSIVPLAHAIKEGSLPQDFLVNQPDRSFFQCQAGQIEPLIRVVIEKAKKKGFTSRDIQVLAPMYKGPAGIDALNRMMQEIFNPNEGKRRREVTSFDVVYRVGDKVLQLVNQPELNVFNGDMGEISAIQYARETEDKVDEITIMFDTVEVTYKRNDWNKFALAYCCSIHKAQGSEFSMVILPMVRQYGRMLKRNLLYTAITRSQDKLILCGDLQAFQLAAENTGDYRKTLLMEKLLRNADQKKGQFTAPQRPAAALTKEENAVAETGASETEKEQPDSAGFTLTVEMIREGRIDPMIGMNDLTPYSFLQEG